MESLYDTAPEVSYTDKPGERYLRMVWRDGDVVAEAKVQQVGRALRATEVTVRARNGIPAAARRLPSDGRLVQHLRDAGNEGITALALVLGEWDEMADVVRAEQRLADGGEAEFELEEALAEYGRQVNKRSRTRIDNQVREIAGWLDEGWSAKRIIEELRARGLAERTAYRRLKSAKSLGNRPIRNDTEVSDD